MGFQLPPLAPSLALLKARALQQGMGTGLTVVTYLSERDFQGAAYIGAGKHEKLDLLVDLLLGRLELGALALHGAGARLLDEGLDASLMVQGLAMAAL